jgi:hypothetical protein
VGGHKTRSQVVANAYFSKKIVNGDLFSENNVYPMAVLI